MKSRPPAGASSASAAQARLRPHLARLTSFLIVFAVGYSLGLLSSSTRPSPRTSQTTLVRPQASHLTDNASASNGTAAGASALHMAAVSRNLSLSPAILCIDDFRGWPAFRDRFRRDVPPPRHGDALLLPQFMSNVVAAAAAPRVLPLPFSTASALTALCEWGVYADLIEVDAGHDFHSAWADINLAWAVLRPGGVMFGHDYFTSADDRGVRRAVTLFARVKGLTVRPHGQHWVLSPKPHVHGSAR